MNPVSRPAISLPISIFPTPTTVARQCLCTKKNRKLRLLHELYPDVKCRIIYRNDYQRLALKYGWGGEPDLPGISCVRRRPGPPDITVAE
jgi:hypothetical protein